LSVLGKLHGLGVSHTPCIHVLRELNDSVCHSVALTVWADRPNDPISIDFTLRRSRWHYHDENATLPDDLSAEDTSGSSLVAGNCLGYNAKPATRRPSTPIPVVLSPMTAAAAEDDAAAAVPVDELGALEAVPDAVPEGVAEAALELRLAEGSAELSKFWRLVH
jgi:hypothetical protein